jgi:sugar/nucleoside kinase (ribokinase family)
VSSASVTVIGCVQVDILVTRVDDLPPPGTARFVEGMSVRAGGAGANVAFGLAEAGMPVRLIGCVGDDRFGDWMLEQLAPAGLDREIRRVGGGQTGLTVALEGPGRDRTFLTFLGVNADWSLSMIGEDALRVDNLLFCDYFCAPALQGDAARRLLSQAKAAGATTFFDTAWDPHGWTASTRDELRQVLAHVDVFLPNEAEARVLCDGARSIEEAARQLHRVSGGWVVVKLGARGCIAVGPHGRELAVSAQSVEVTDSTGAGDAFNAGLVAALAGGQDWPEALAAATELATTIVSRPSRSRHVGPIADARLTQSGSGTGSSGHGGAPQAD